MTHLLATANRPGPILRGDAGLVQVLILLALLAVVIGIPAIIVLLVRRPR